MSEAKKLITRWSRDFQGNLQEDPNGFWVLAADAAIRDKRLMDKIDELQQRLTAVDERADVLEVLLLQTNELLYAIQGDPGAVPSSSIDAMRGEVFAALKPAEHAKDEHVCTGCGSKGWTANCKECVPY